MKEELQTKLIEILGSIQSAASKAGDFALTQLPDIAQSYVAYGRWSSVVAVLASLAVVGVALALVARGVKVTKEDLSEETNSTRFYMKYDRLPRDGYCYFFPAAIMGAFGLMFLGLAVQSALLVWIAPKVWLLKEIAGLLK
jgi:hypothetical protein